MISGPFHFSATPVMVSAPIAYLHEPTFDGRTIRSLCTSSSTIPVFGTWPTEEPDPHCWHREVIGEVESVQVSVEADRETVIAKMRLMPQWWEALGGVDRVRALIEIFAPTNNVPVFVDAELRGIYLISVDKGPSIWPGDTIVTLEGEGS